MVACSCDVRCRESTTQNHSESKVLPKWTTRSFMSKSTVRNDIYLTIHVHAVTTLMLALKKGIQHLF